MAKCCVDLLPAQEQQQRQQRQGPASSAAPPADAATDEQARQLLEASAGREHALRARVLRLLFVADPGGGVAPVTGAAAAAAAAAAAQGPEEDDEDAAGDVDEDGGSGGGDEGAGGGGAAEGQVGAAASGVRAAAGATSSARVPGRAPAVRTRRGKPVQTLPLRTPEQVGSILQLPRSRVLRLIERAPRSIRLVADPEPLQVVFEDDAFLAALKPPGLRSAPSHRFLGGSALNRMIGHLGGREPHLLHRLDMDTSGVLVAAKDVTTARAAHAQFRDKGVRKAYLAIALGVPGRPRFTVDGPIAQHPAVAVARRVAAGGLPAVTHVQVLSANADAALIPPLARDAEGTGPCPRGSGASAGAGKVWGPAAEPGSVGAGACLVCCFPVTGRTHQIRVHMAHVGHPLLGDDVYGLQGEWIGRQALHALALELLHPTTGRRVTFAAPPPEDFVAAAGALGLRVPPMDAVAALVASSDAGAG